jgi:hypothetical protein
MAHEYLWSNHGKNGTVAPNGTEYLSAPSNNYHDGIQQRGLGLGGVEWGLFFMMSPRPLFGFSLDLLGGLASGRALGLSFVGGVVDGACPMYSK